MLTGKQYESPKRKGIERTLTTLEEKILKNQNDDLEWYDPLERTTMPNPIFFYTTEQMADTDPERNENFLKELTTFLDLEDETLLTSQGMPPHVRPCKSAATRGPAMFDEKIHICDEKYDELRESLLQISRMTSDWILNEGFLDSPTVSVANREHVEEILLSYKIDPCLGTN